MPSTYDLVETEVANSTPAEPLAALVDWSRNFDFPTPWNLFLDIVGVNQDRDGEAHFVPVAKGRFGVRGLDSHAEFRGQLGELYERKIGYHEQALLGAALTAWAEHPGDCRMFVEALENANED